MADYYTLLTNAGIAYETACKATGVPIKLAQISVGDGNAAVITFGSTTAAVREALARAAAQGVHARLVALRLLAPLLVSVAKRPS